MKTQHHYQLADAVKTVTIQPEGSAFLITVDDKAYSVTASLIAPGQLSLTIEGRQTMAHVITHQSRQYVAIDGHHWLVYSTASHRPQWAQAPTQPGVTLGRLEATMPGVILEVQVTLGDTVTQGQTLLLLEAMKMELRLTAPCDGTVTQIICQPGQIVERGAFLAEISCGT